MEFKVIVYETVSVAQVVEIDGRPKIEVEYKSETKSFFAEEISSMVLTKMKETAEAYLGHDVKDAVVTVPAVSLKFKFILFYTRVKLENISVSFLQSSSLGFVVDTSLTETYRVRFPVTAKVISLWIIVLKIVRRRKVFF